MARKVGKRASRYLAKLVTENRAPCAFCHREVDDEVTYGKLYAIGDIQCHYFCALLSCCLVQKGPEQEGLFGFMYKDILAELERSKKHKCSFCSKGGANLGCSISSCRKQFHLPCGRERNAVSLYYGTYKSFCKLHAPKQSIPEHIMCKAKLRLKGAKVLSTQGDDSTEDMVCVICYEVVDGFPTVNTFWPPCCGKDAWFHRSCIQRMALSAGMHYLKCPLCNDKQNFYDAVIDQGYYVPDRDAAWELEQNAFAEIYERPLNCTAETCDCPMGRNHDADQGDWDIKLCLLCGSVGAHAHCIGASETTRYVCLTCTPAAPEDIQTLADTIEKLIIQEQASTSTTQCGPVMPSRMSLRRTKGRPDIANRPSSSRSHDVKTECENIQSPLTIASRQELNLSTPRKLIQPTKPDSYNLHRNEVSYKSIESFKRLKSPVKINQTPNNGSPYKCMEALNSHVKLYASLHGNNEVSYKMDGTPTYKHEMDEKLMSPMKLLEQSLNEKTCMRVKDLDEEVVEMLRKKFRKPGPLSQKRKIMEDILDGLITNLNTSEKHKDQLREWCSPRNSCDITEEILPSEGSTKLTENTGENKEASIQETPKKSTRNYRKKSATDGECHSSYNNIDLNSNETKIGNEGKELGNKEISENVNGQGKYESVKTVESEERTDEASLEVSPNKSTRSRRKKYATDGESHNSYNNIDLNSNETKTGKLDHKEISENINGYGKDESAKTAEPEERTDEASLEVTPNKSTRSYIKKSATDGECHSSYNNIDLNSNETKIGNDSKELSEDINEHGNNESVQTVEPEERTDVASQEVTSKKSARSRRKKLATDGESHYSYNNIDFNASEGNDSKELSEDINEHGNDESVKTVEVEKTDVATLEVTTKKSTRSRRKKSAKAGERHNNKNIDFNATKPKIGNDSKELDNKEISEEINDHGNDESVKTESEERRGVASLEVDIDDSSTNTFQLPPEFIANTQSDKSHTSSSIRKTMDAIFSPSKDLKVKSGDDASEAKCAFKFSPLDKEKLEKNNVDISLESFKKTYLCEIGKEKSSFDKRGKGNLSQSSVKDFEVDANLKEKIKPKKRKHSEGKLVLVFNKNDAKKRKLSEKDTNLSSSDEFEEKKEIKSPLAKKKDKFKVKILSKRHEKKRVKDKVRNEKILGSKTYKKIKIADKTIMTEEKEITVENIEREKHENISNPDDASDISNKTVIDKENGPPKRKFQECSQWMAKITELDKKLKIEAKRKARKNKRNLKNKKFETSGKDATLNMQKEYSQNNKTDKQKLRTDRNRDSKKFDKDKVKETKEVTTKANEVTEDGEIKKEKIKKHKKEMLSRQQKRQHKSGKKDKKHKAKYEESKQNDQNIELTIDSSEKKKKNKMKTKLSIRNNEKDISVKIKWKKKQLRLKIKESKKEKIKKNSNDHSKFKQYVLQYFSEITPKEVLVKPEKQINPLKRKYVKQEKSPDKLKQMSIQNFFKTTPPK